MQMNNLTNDQELITAYCQGDNVAIALLFHRHYKVAYAAASKVLRDKFEAEDLVFEELKKLFDLPIEARGSKFHPETNVAGFIYTLIKRRSVDRQRRAVAVGDDEFTAHIMDENDQRHFQEQARLESELDFLSRVSGCRKVLTEADDRFLSEWVEAGPANNPPLASFLQSRWAAQPAVGPDPHMQPREDARAGFFSKKFMEEAAGQPAQGLPARLLLEQVRTTKFRIKRRILDCLGMA